MKFSLSRVATFAGVAVVSALLLELFPFYPFYFTLILALVLGAVALEFPSLGMILAILLSVFGALYQNSFVGLTYLVVFLIVIALSLTWIETALIAGSWILAFFVPPSLAIVPAALAGLHLNRQDAIKIGAVSGLSVFLLSWARSITQAGLMLVPFPSSGYNAKPIPEPWNFAAFIPSADVLSTTRLGDYYAPLASNIGDFRIYGFIALWAVAGFLTALLALKLKGYASVAAPVVGVLPAIVFAGLFAQTPVLQMAMVVVAAAVVAFAYKFVQPMISVPTIPVFTGLDDLVPTGIPQKYGLLLGSPACDERNLVVEQFVQSGFKKKVPCFMLTTDISLGQSAAQKFGENLTVLVSNPRATAGAEKNVVPVPTGVQNLTALNIELVRVVKDHAASGGRVCLDVLSDIMLSQKLLMTRKWVTDIVPRLEGWGFTVLGVFNPGLHSNEEVQGLVELFNGYIEIFDKEYAGRTRKLIAVRKMADLQYNENELLIDKQRLLRQKGGLMARLSK